MMSDAQKSGAKMTDAEKEMRAYKRIPLVERQASFWAGIGASIAFGVGTESFAIGLGIFLALFSLASSLSNEMSKHRGCKDSES